MEAWKDVATEPTLAPYLNSTILSSSSLEEVKNKHQIGTKMSSLKSSTALTCMNGTMIIELLHLRHSLSF